MANIIKNYFAEHSKEMTKQTFAKNCKLSYPYVINLLKEDKDGNPVLRPGKQAAKKIAKATGLPLADLMGPEKAARKRRAKKSIIREEQKETYTVHNPIIVQVVLPEKTMARLQKAAGDNISKFIDDALASHFKQMRKSKQHSRRQMADSLQPQDYLLGLVAMTNHMADAEDAPAKKRTKKTKAAPALALVQPPASEPKPERPKTPPKQKKSAPAKAKKKRPAK